MIDYPEKESYTAEDLVQITALLRDPVDGCPWDKVQTHTSIRKNFLEETYEVLEAIDTNDAHLLCEELGDVLMQVALHACMETEQGNFTFADVCTAVCEKLIYRHPHIFSCAAQIKTQEEGLNSWELLKNKEKGRVTLADELNSVPKPLPALMKAQKLQKRAAPYQKVSTTPQDAVQEVEARYGQWQQTISQGEKTTAAPLADDAKTAAGLFLFAAVNQLRLAGVDAEEALSLANDYFVAESLKETQFSDGK